MSSITIFDINIPVHEYMTGHEWEAVETILADPPVSPLRTDLTVLKAFIESRTDAKLDVDEAMDSPVPGDDIAEAVERLTAPFVTARRKRAERQIKTQASLLTPEALRERKMELLGTLKVIERALSENAGDASKRSSSTTTPGTASKGGAKGRSRKPSN